MNNRKLRMPRPQASADPLGELYAMRAEEAPKPQVESWAIYTENRGPDKGNGSHVITLLFGMVSGLLAATLIARAGLI